MTVNHFQSSDEIGSPPKKEFKVLPTTKIGFGKLKNQPHSAFLKEENKKYAKWIIDQGSEFRYKDSRNFILDNQQKSLTEEELIEIASTPIGDLSDAQITLFLNER